MAELTSTMHRSMEPSPTEYQDQETPSISGGGLSQNTQITQRMDEGPQIDPVKDLHCYGTSFSVNGDGSSQLKSEFACFINDDDVAYIGQFGETEVSSLTPQVLRGRLKRIPDEELFPKKPKDITVFSLPITKDLYKKSPSLPSWEDFEGTDQLPKMLLGEIETFELLRKNPHPSNIRYHGCTVSSRGRVTGIVMDRYPTTLWNRLENEPHNFNKHLSFKDDLESAVKHLHSLGLAHNDLHPYNIMVDEHDRPSLIDFDACKPFGSHLMKCGTEEWIEKPRFISDKRDDETALQKILAWIGEKTAS